MLHSPLLKGFRPRNLQGKMNVSYHPIIHLLNHQSQAFIALKRFLMLYEHMQEVCVYVPCLMQRSGGPLIQLTSLMRIVLVP